MGFPVPDWMKSKPKFLRESIFDDYDSKPDKSASELSAAAKKVLYSIAKLLFNHTTFTLLQITN